MFKLVSIIAAAASLAAAAPARAAVFTIATDSDFDVGSYAGTRVEASGSTAQLSLSATASGAWQAVGAGGVEPRSGMTGDGSRYVHWVHTNGSGYTVRTYDALLDTASSSAPSPYSTVRDGDIALLGGTIYWSDYGSAPGLSFIGRYDVVNGFWSLGSTPLPNSASAAVLEAGQDGFLYVIDSSGRLLRYDAAADSFATLGAAGCSGGRARAGIAVAGAAAYRVCYPTGSLYRQDLATGALSSMSSLPTPTGEAPQLAYDGDDTIYATLGHTHTDFFAYSIAGNVWRRLPSLPEAISYPCCASPPGLTVLGGASIFAHAATTASGAAQQLWRFDVVSDYVATGSYTSRVLDSDGLPDWDRFYWSSDVPPGTTLRAQLATSASASGPFSFVGPDGTPATYYTAASGTLVHSSHDGERYAQMRFYLDTTTATLSPHVMSASLSFAFNAMAITTPTPLASAVSGRPYPSLTFQAAGGVQPYSWRVSADALPAGLSLAGDGTLSGTPTGEGNVAFTVEVTDQDSPPAVASKRFSLYVAPAPVAPVISPSASTSGAVGVGYVYDASVIIGTAPVTWSAVSGPADLNIDPFTGEVTWTPLAAGLFDVTIRAANDAGTDDYSFQIDVAAEPQAPTILPTASSSATASMQYRYDDDNTPDFTGTEPISWSVVQGPTDFRIHSTSGFVDWTPQVAGSFDITLRAANVAGHYDYSFTVQVGPPPTPPLIDETAALSATVGQPYTYDASAQGTAPIVWSIVLGPTGFGIDAGTGVVGWTPQAAGNVAIELRATNVAGFDTYAFTVAVAPPSSCAQRLPAPLLLAPQDGAMGLPTSHDLLWQPVPGARDYALELIELPAGAVPDFSGAAPVVVGDTSYTAVAGELTRYAWRVAARDAEGCTGDTSAARTFATGAGSAVLAAVAQGMTATEAALGGDYHAGPITGRAQLVVLWSGERSVARSGRPIALYEWDGGDGMPPESGASVSHTYVLPGGFRAHLVVTDDEAEVAEDEIQILVSDTQGRVPPQIDATATPSRGTVAQSFTFTAAVARGDGDIRALLWDLGDGNRKSGGTLTHTYSQPGTYVVRATAVDANGLAADDFAAVTVTDLEGGEAPSVRLYALPATADVGDTALSVQLVCDARGSISSAPQFTWDFDDGTADLTSNSAIVMHDYDEAPDGRLEYRPSCTVSNGLYTSSDSVRITLTKSGQLPPRILSIPGAAACAGEPYIYNDLNQAAARGSGPMLWRLGKRVADSIVGAPAGFDVDFYSGIVRWVPDADQIGAHEVVLVAENNAGHDVQQFTIAVSDCQATPSLRVAARGCNCAASAAPLGLVVLAVTLARRRRASAHSCSMTRVV